MYSSVRSASARKASSMGGPGTNQGPVQGPSLKERFSVVGTRGFWACLTLRWVGLWWRLGGDYRDVRG